MRKTENHPGAAAPLRPRGGHRPRGLSRWAAGVAAGLGGAGIVLLALPSVNPLPTPPPFTPPPSARVQWQGPLPANTLRMLAPSLPGVRPEPPGSETPLGERDDLSLAGDIRVAPPHLLLEQHDSWDEWFLLRPEEATERPLILENTGENLRRFGRQPENNLPTFPPRVIVEWTDLTTGQSGQSALPPSEALLDARRESSNLVPAVFLLQRESGGVVREALRTASSGSSAVDRQLGDLLRTSDLALPPSTHYLRLTVHLPPLPPDA